MSHEIIHTLIVPLQAIAAIAFLVALVSLALLIYANPLGATAQEILYLRANALKTPLGLLAVIVLLESMQFLIPALVAYKLVPIDEATFDATLATFNGAVDLLQAVLLVAASMLTIRIFKRYTRRGVRAWADRATTELVSATRRRKIRPGDARER